MRTPKIMLIFGTLALAVASAATHRLTFNDLVWLGQNQLKAGDYRLEIKGTQAIIMGDHKKEIAVPVTIEKASQKFDTTSFLTQEIGGKSELTEIRIGGTHDKVLLPMMKPAGPSGS